MYIMKIDPVFIKAVAFLLIAILIACLFSEPRCEGFKGEVKVHNLKSFGHDSKAWFAPANAGQHSLAATGAGLVAVGTTMGGMMRWASLGQHEMKQMDTDVTPIETNSTLTGGATELDPNNPITQADAVTDSIPVKLATNPNAEEAQLLRNLKSPVGTAENQVKFATKDPAEFDDEVVIDDGT